MKKVFILVLLGAICMIGNAQDRKNALKFLPANLPLNSFSFAYERMVNPKNSFELGIGIPMEQSFVNKFSMDSDEEEDISNDKLGIFSIRAAYKHYTGKSMEPKGFYYSPYIKYQAISTSVSRTEEEEDDEGTFSYNEDYDAKINTIGIGFQLGYQFLIAKRVTLDLYFLGLEAGFANADVAVSTSDQENVGDIESDIQSNIDDFPSFWRDKIEVSSQGNTVKIKGSNLPYPWYRGGVSIGIVF